MVLNQNLFPLNQTFVMVKKIQQVKFYCYDHCWAFFTYHNKFLSLTLNQCHRDPLFLAFFTDNIFIVNEKELLFNLKRYYQIKPGSMMTWNNESQKRLFTCKVLNLFKTIYYLIKTHNYLLPEKNPSPLLRNGWLIHPRWKLFSPSSLCVTNLCFQEPLPVEPIRSLGPL